MADLETIDFEKIVLEKTNSEVHLAEPTLETMFSHTVH